MMVLPAVSKAQDDCSGCDSDTADAKACDTAKKDVAKSDATKTVAVAIPLANARKDLSSWRTELLGLSRIERDLIKSASKTVFEKDVNAKALAPTFGAAADLLAILARVDSGAAENAVALSTSYRAMAQALAGKDSYSAQPMSNATEMKAAMVKAMKDSAAAQKMWAKAKKTLVSKEDAQLIADSMKLLNAGSPRMRALATNLTATGMAVKSVKLSDDAPDGDPAGAMLKSVQSLQMSAAPFFAKVNTEKPAVMAPASDCAPGGG